MVQLLLRLLPPVLPIPHGCLSGNGHWRRSEIFICDWPDLTGWTTWCEQLWSAESPSSLLHQRPLPVKPLHHPDYVVHYPCILILFTSLSVLTFKSFKSSVRQDLCKVCGYIFMLCVSDDSSHCNTVITPLTGCGEKTQSGFFSLLSSITIAVKRIYSSMWYSCSQQERLCLTLPNQFAHSAPPLPFFTLILPPPPAACLRSLSPNRWGCQ